MKRRLRVRWPGNFGNGDRFREILEPGSSTEGHYRLPLRVLKGLLV